MHRMETPRGSAGEPGERPADGSEPVSEDLRVRRPRRRSSRRRRILVVAGLAVAAVLIAGITIWWVNGSDGEPEPATTTTSVPTTTTEPTVLPGGTVEVATVKASLDAVTVSAEPPEGWDDMPVSLVMDPPPARPPFSQNTMPAREPLPAPDDPIVGRAVVEDGWEFSNPGPYMPPQPFTMVVTERRGEWVKVQLPVRPNGTEGWVRLSDVDLSTTSYRIEINLTEQVLRTFNDTELVAESAVVIGTGFSQTPTGSFYVTDIVPQENPSFGPVALATNGYSEMLDEFDDGVPVIAIHGTDAPERMGEAISNGCIRVPNEIIEQLAGTVPLGTPIYIWP